MLPKQRIKVERPVCGQRSDSGEEIPMQPILIYENLKAVVQNYSKAELFTHATGTTDFYYIRIFIKKRINQKPTDIQVRDIITDVKGVKYLVTDVLLRSVIPHLEIICKSKVI